MTATGFHKAITVESSSIIGDSNGGWVSAKIPQIAHINMGQSPPGSSYNEDAHGFPFFQGKADFGERFPTVRVWCTEPKKIAHPGDVLISVRAPVGPTNVANSECIIGRGLAALTPLGGIATEFLLFALRLQEPELALRGAGSTFTAINKADIEDITVQVPPLAEQKRIVTQVESMLARLNVSRERLAGVPSILRRFRQSVLAAACLGKLSADCCVERKTRAVIRDEVDPELLEIAQQWEEFPLHWDIRSLNNLRDERTPISYGVLKPGRFVQGGVPLLRIVDIADEEVKAENVHRIPISLSQQYKRTILRGGEILVSLVGTIGRIALVPHILAGANIHRNLGLVAPGNEVLADYLYFAMLSPIVQKQIEVVTSGANQPLFNLIDLRRIVIPVPPLNEQRIIASRVRSLLGIVNMVEKRVASATARADKLAQSILAKAFRGELVPTEAELARREGRDYEPASVLLERIRKEREASKQGGPDRLKRQRARARSAAAGLIESA